MVVSQSFRRRSRLDRARISRNQAGEYFVEDAVAVDAEAVKAMRDAGALVVDVRDGGSYDRSHVPGARHLDLNVGLSEAALSALVAKDDSVIFYCWGKYCPYSAYAAAKANLWGFSRVHRFAGGLPAWEDSGRPIEETVTE